MQFGGAHLMSEMIAALPLALAGGTWIFLIIVIVFLFAVIFGFYTVTGSGISLTPYRRAGGPPESPPEIAHDITSEVRDWERGTEGHHRRYRPAASQTPPDPEVAQALREWRRSDRRPRLDPPIGAADHVRGPDGAQTIALYVDLAAQPCRSALGLVEELCQQRPLRLAIRHLPLADVHPLALPAAEALEAAAAQGRFFDTLQGLSQHGFRNEAELLDRVAPSVPDPNRLRADVTNGRFRATIVEHIRQATASGARAVPEVFIDGEHYGGALTPDPLSAALDGREWRTGLR